MVEMERSRNRTRRNQKAKKSPKVPIKTYRWEDVRRARRRGGYPWTHLYKGPFTEKIDPEQYTMDALRRAKSASPMGRRSDRIEISEISSWADYSGKTTPTLLQELISEPESTSAKNSRPGSVVIEEYFDYEDKDLEDDVQIKEFPMDSDSDNISQYLDKEDREPTTSKGSKKKVNGSKDSVTEREKRAHSEEASPRKRKVSAESGHSRYSLSRLSVLKKLKDAKSKIKVTFPTKKIPKIRTSPPKDKKPKKEATKKNHETTKLRKPDKPVYIHIPLKPPPGETDEFSHLEFEESKPLNGQEIKLEEPEIVKDEELPKIDKDKVEIAKDEELPKIDKDKVEIAKDKELPNIDKDKEISKVDTQTAVDETKSDNNSPFGTLEKGPKVTKKPPLKINPAFKQLLKDVRQLKDKELAESTTKIESKPPETPGDNDEKLDLAEQQLSETDSPKETDFDQLFQASVDKKPAEQLEATRQERSKSAEPQSKRRSSIDSGYSRKSMSKLAIVKKLRDAGEKIKDAGGRIRSALSLDNLRKKFSKEDEENKRKQEGEASKPKKPKFGQPTVQKRPTSVVKPGQFDKPKKPVEPVYIHIPLKPPEGQTDAFSYLENETVGEIPPEPKKEERTDSLDSASSPISPRKDGIHFIFLTPPSDDEILDKEADIPETPSSASDDIMFFSSLKKLAKDAVDQVSPESTKAALETVREEIDKGSSNDTETVNGKETEELPKEEQTLSVTPIDVSENPMIVDAEDGLSEPSRTEEQLKSALKTSTESTSLKRVSFKRKSKTPKDTDKPEKPETDKPNHYYEEIAEPKEETKPDEVKLEEEVPKVSEIDVSVNVEEKKPALSEEMRQSMSVEEEKSYLDQKIMKDTSLEENYNRWSKASSDHEYESVDPPDELIISPELPHATVISSESGPKLVISATEILDKPVEEKKRAFFHIGKFGKDKDKNHEGSSSETQSRSSQVREIPEMTEPKKPEGPNKFQLAFKQGTEQLKTKTSELKNKIHNIHMPKGPEFKRPHFKKPEFKRFKIEKPKINLHMPKIPDTATIKFKNISLPGSRKSSETKTIERRQYSTESNADASEDQNKRRKFDLSFGSTFPRFKKTKRAEVATFGTVPRNKVGSEKSTTLSSEGSSSVRIPLHSEDSTDVDDRLALEEDIESKRTGYEDRETSADIDRLRGRRLSEELAIEEEFERENQAINRADYLRRWQHGNFKERKDDEDNEDERIVGQLVEQRFGKEGYSYYENQPGRPETLEERLRSDEQRISQYIEDEDGDFDIGQNKHLVTDLDVMNDDPVGHGRDGYSSEGSVGLQRKGRLGKLDVDSDEFFVVHEIREGFQTPANALAQMNEYDPIGSNRSLPIRTEPEPIRSERKPIKKPKRKKTPHVSREEIPGDEESLEGVIAPSRPKRRSKKSKKKLDEEPDIVPYQETISLEEREGIRGERLEFPRESLGILGDDERDDQEVEMYENERMKGKEQPKITVTDPYPYRQFHTLEQKFRETEELPSAPPRKHRSLKSLTMSENDSILTDSRYERDRSVDTATLEDQILQDQQIAAAPPRRPQRRSRSQTSSLSRMSLPPSQRDSDSIFTEEGYLFDNQQIPSYLIENRSFKEQFREMDEAPHLEGGIKPCTEEPCVQDIRDYMGYSVTGKTKRDPPLPPPRTPPRRRKREVSSEEKFATVPRNMGLSQATPPTRPLRNYSTLSQVRTSRSSKDSTSSFKNDQDKENEVDIGRYLEIDDEIKELASGEVVRKMRERPLPAPPRPPRKTKSTRKSLQDITSKENILPTTSDPKPELNQEETVSTQTEPLPPDFVCEEIKQDPTDTIITPRMVPPRADDPVVIQRFELHDPRTEPPQVRRELITPTSYTFEETVTHGTLLVQPIDGAKVVPDHQLSRERLVPITRDSEDETSEVPESFRQLRSPEQSAAARRIETDVLKAEKIQVSDLDVDRLSVNQLLASKLIVSEIDSSTITTSEIQGKNGTIKLGDIELPPQLLEQLVKQLPKQPQTQEAPDSQKKTPTDSKPLSSSPPPVESSLSPVEEPLDRLQEDQCLPSSRLSEAQERRESSVGSAEGFRQLRDLSPEPPAPPPRGCTLEGGSPEAPPRTLRRKSKDSPRLASEEPLSSTSQVSPLRNEMLEPEIDDEEPPPRPPQPLEGRYLPSQPPASFYALRAKQYVDENIPTAPRRKRHRSRPVSRSRSTSDDSSTIPRRPSRLQRRASEPSITDLSGRLVQACCFRINNTLKRLIYHLTENLLQNADGNQDLHVVMVILLVLIAGLILLGYGEDRTVVHLHHWEYFNPPKDL